MLTNKYSKQSLDHVFNCIFSRFQFLRDRGAEAVVAPLCPGSQLSYGTLPLTTMADTKGDDPDVSSIARGEESLGYEMPVLSAAAQIAREPLSVVPDPDSGEERHCFARAGALQIKGSYHCDGGDGACASHWRNSSANIVAPRDPEEEHGDFAAPITRQARQGPPSFAQSEFHTVR